MGPLRRRMEPRLAAAVVDAPAAGAARPDRPAARRRRPGPRRGARAADAARPARRPAAPRRRARRRRRPLDRRARPSVAAIVRRANDRARRRCRPGGSASHTPARSVQLQRRRRCSCSSTPTSGPGPGCSTGSPPARRARRGGVGAAVARRRHDRASALTAARQRRRPDGQRRVHDPRHPAAARRSRSGPCSPSTAPTYDAVGGHGHPAVRASLTEDIALARRRRAQPAVHAPAGTPRSACTRAGLGQSVAGWSRTMAAGLAATRWWLALAVAAWVWSLAGGPFTGWLAYPLSAVQVWVLGRRAGRLGPVLAAALPGARRRPRRHRRPRGVAAGPRRHDVEGPRRCDVGVTQRTSRRILPTLASASMRACAAATSSSGKRRSITGRSAPDVNSGSTSSAKRRQIVAFSSSGRPRSVGADPAGPLDQQQPDVDVGLAAAHQADLDDRALRPHGAQVAVDLVAADDVEDRCRRRPCSRGAASPACERGRPVGGRALEHEVGAERTAGVHLPGRARHRDAGADGLGDLDARPCRRRTHRRGSAPSARSSAHPARRARPTP